jgi:hypothetical protein
MNIAAGREHPEVEQRQENKEPWRLTLPDRESVFVGELAEPGEWIVANIQTNSTWPVNAQKVMYHERAFWILPLMKGFYPASP